MKKYIIAILSILILASCENFLDEEQVGKLQYNYYETEEGIEDLIKACYEPVRWKTGHEWTYAFFNFGTDEFKRGDHAYTTHALGGYNDYTSMINPLGEEDNPEGVWSAIYNGIDRCNLAVEKIPLVTDGVGIMRDEEGKNMRMGEARFIRAWLYFLLVQQWGAIPLKLEPTKGLERYFVRNSVSEIYEAIIDDLTFAVENCPETQDDYGRVTKDAARHYLAKVLLTRACLSITSDSDLDINNIRYSDAERTQDLQDAVTYAEACINSGNHSLLPNFADVFEQGNEVNDEIVFSAQFNDDLTLLGDNAYQYRNMTHVFFANQYDNPEEQGMERNIEYGRPFRRTYITDYAIDIHDRLNDSRLRKSMLEVYYSTGLDQSDAPVWTADQLLFAFTDVAADGSWAIRDGDTVRAGDYTLTVATATDDANYVNLGDTCIVFLINDKDHPITDREIVARGYKIYPRYYVLTDASGNIISDVLDEDTTLSIGYRIEAWRPGKTPSLVKHFDRNRADVQSYQGVRDFFHARLSETYLIAAEAHGRLGDYASAVDHINVVRRRAAYMDGEERQNLHTMFDGGTAGDLSSTEANMIINESYWDNDVALEHYTSPSLTKEERFIEFILNERCRELLGELVRWEDMVARLDGESFVERVKMFNDDARESNTVQPFHKIRPIPQSHLDAIRNSGGEFLTASEKQTMQNPGY
ncbi:RagB/SusD family nutrient uptake outer membrane protein [Bacteroidota bacterium]